MHGGDDVRRGQRRGVRGPPYTWRSIPANMTIAINNKMTTAAPRIFSGPRMCMAATRPDDWAGWLKSAKGAVGGRIPGCGGDDESAATATYKMVCGGMWLMSDFQGSFGDQKFSGRGLDGYDPEKKKYVSVWVDSMSTRPMFLEGTHDKEKKTTTMTGEAPGPDGKLAKHKMVTHTPDDDHQTFTMYIIDADGKENKIMTIEYTRKK